MKKHRTSLQLWGMPILIGLLSLGGLVNALIYDGWGDILSWILLACPLIVVCFFTLKTRSV